MYLIIDFDQIQLQNLLILKIFTEIKNAITKSFSKAASGHMNGFPKAAVYNSSLYSFQFLSETNSYGY